MTTANTIRLLLLNNSKTEAERLVSMLHASGKPNRAQYVENEESLIKLLQEQTWDLLIGKNNTTNPPPANAIKQIQRLNKDVPVILLNDAEDPSAIVKGLKLGAMDVINVDDDQHLLLVIDRELRNREQRQAKRSADRRFREAEKRSQQFLDSSRDAIAYVQDGLYLYANESFANLFEYEDKDDIEAMPIIDMASKADQPRLKKFLKDFTLKGDEAELTTLSFKGVTQTGVEKPINLEVSLVTHNEEACIQFLARASNEVIIQENEINEELEAQIKQIKWQDLVTGLYNRQFFLNELDRVINSTNEDKHLSLLYIELDEFTERVQQSFGVSGADIALANIASILRAKVHTNDVVARLSDTSFALIIPNIKADAAVARAQQLCKDIETHIIDIDNKTLQITSSIGIAIINETSTNTNACIEQARSAMEKVRNNKGNGAMLFEPEATEKNSKQDISQAIQQALDADKFKLLFQPIISLRGSAEEYYEVYLRMINQEGSEVSPNQFLDIAEEIKANTKIDRWVILESIKMLAEHRHKGNKTKLIVNLSRHSICDDSLVPWLAVAFKAAKLTPDSLVFQVSEIDVTNHLNATKLFAEGLEKMKAQFSISNFGCSLNPFNALKHVTASFIKIDGSFTTDIQSNNESPETLINLISKLHGENKITIVPFVENASVLSTLWQAGAHYIQGHYLQEPTHQMSYDFSMEN